MAWLTAPVVYAIATAASTAVSVYSAWSSHQSEKEAANKQEKYLRLQAEQARLANEQKALDYKRRAAAALGMERSRRGASGIGEEGSPLLTYFENARVFDEDVARIKQGAEIEERGYMQKIGLQQSYAKAQQQAAWLDTGQTLLTGATNLLRKI